ncbi:small oligopeptide transporter [Thelephora ganbajun]|uniref:Small oligopeptide transporter n=1 Tax=Thelephora ganbajun TaxID=370292 RepID=A0ACB6Z403_THEGA|nr:small oligopeptide transporter [Thelephora ganbajun]
MPLVPFQHSHSQSSQDSPYSHNSYSEDYDPTFDPNFDEDAIYDESPYPEVRSAVANFDDPEMPVNTFRAWVIGLFWAVVLPGINQFFFFRYPTVTVGGLVAQLVSYPMGRLWARFMPRVKVFGVSLNPGPFTIKEHVLVTIMAGIGSESAYATDIIAVQRVSYKQTWSFAYQWLLVMSTQLIGLSTGGIARRLLVAPPSMIWPNTLVICALFNTLHSQKYLGADDTGPSRERFFTYAFIGAALWYFVPGYLFQALSMFNWVCWIAPDNTIVNQIFGFRGGLGFSLFTFDWNEIAYIGSPYNAGWSEANVAAGFVLFFWVVTPIIYYTDTWYSKRLPLVSWKPYDNTGVEYQVGRVLNQDGTFNVQHYKAYSPLFLSTSFAIAYGLSFASITATIVHSILYFWKPIRVHLRRSLREQPDIHAKLMSNYRQVPEWWYAILFAINFIFACLSVQLWPTHLPIWALVIGLLIAVVYIVPIGMILAITNRQVGLNVVSELIIGYMLPGRPVAMMIQAMVFTADFKLGHYMKIPPRVMFSGQILAIIVAGTVQLGVQTWMFNNIPDMCSHEQKDKFVCASTQVFATASVVWGVVGPALQFSSGQIYYGLLWFFLIGAFCPLIAWALSKRYPRSWITYIKVLFGGIGDIPPATALNYIPWTMVGFVFQYLIRRRRFSFWAKYNYVLSAALDAGTAISVVLIFFCLQYPLNGSIGANTIQKWWGNTVFQNTVDWHQRPLMSLAQGAKFGCVTS